MYTRIDQISVMVDITCPLSLDRVIENTQPSVEGS